MYHGDPLADAWAGPVRPLAPYQAVMGSRMLGAKARERIEKHFSLDRTVRNFEEVYQGLKETVPHAQNGIKR